MFHRAVVGNPTGTGCAWEQIPVGRIGSILIFEEKNVLSSVLV